MVDVNNNDSLNILSLKDKEVDGLVSKVKDHYNSDEFKHGVEIGKSFGAYETWLSAQKAYDMGEIELWLTFNGAHSEEEWKALYDKYGRGFSERWT